MKIQKLIMLDEEILKKLKEEENASALINGLLINYFNLSENETTEEIQDKIKEIKDRTDLSLDKINFLLMPLVKKEKELIEQSEKEKENQRIASEKKEQAEKNAHALREKTIKRCEVCGKEGNLNELYKCNFGITCRPCLKSNMFEEKLIEKYKLTEKVEIERLRQFIYGREK